MRLSRFIYLCRPLFLWVFCLTSHAQQKLASPRPGPSLMWQHTSHTAQQRDGPVLYQLLLNASGSAGTVPVFDTNPRHLTNSPITVSGGNIVIGGVNGLNINGSSGLITFARGQTFPGAIGVNNVTVGNSYITIGGAPSHPPGRSYNRETRPRDPQTAAGPHYRAPYPP